MAVHRVGWKLSKSSTVCSQILSFLLCLTVLSTVSQAQSTSSNTVQASVTVPCSFSVNLIAVDSEYALPLLSDVAFTYSVNSLGSGSCSLGSLSGTFSLSNSTNSVYGTTLDYPPSTGSISVSNTLFSSVTSTYAATLTFSGSGT